jgi:4-hydroxy-3-methylbut-2-enyl diphosphate reductase IspH
MDICPLYEKRSKQAIKVIKDLDPEKNYFIVCGDKTSSNAKEIYHAMSLSNPKLKGTIALDSSMLNLNELKGKDIYIASATSVNKDTVEKLKQDLELAI